MHRIIDDLDGDGEDEGALRVHVDMSAIKSSLTIEGEGALDQCLVSSLGPRVKLEALNKRYVHRWSKAVAGAAIKVGPGTDSYVRLSQIPASVRRAMVVTEDGRYWKHPGVSLRLDAATTISGAGGAVAKKITEMTKMFHLC